MLFGGDIYINNATTVSVGQQTARNMTLYKKNNYSMFNNPNNDNVIVYITILIECQFLRNSGGQLQIN